VAGPRSFTDAAAKSLGQIIRPRVLAEQSQ